MDDKLFSVYLTPADYGKLSYAKLELPASPWALLDALDKVRFTEEESLYLEITDYHDFEELHSCLTCSSMSLLELNDLAKRISDLNETQRTAFEGLVRVELQKQEPVTLKRLRGPGGKHGLLPCGGIGRVGWTVGTILCREWFYAGSGRNPRCGI